MISENHPINCLLVARDKVVTKQWRNWVTLWVINITITNGEDGHCMSPDVIFISVLPVGELKQD